MEGFLNLPNRLGRLLVNVVVVSFVWCPMAASAATGGSGALTGDVTPTDSSEIGSCGSLANLITLKPTDEACGAAMMVAAFVSEQSVYLNSEIARLQKDIEATLEAEAAHSALLESLLEQYERSQAEEIAGPLYLPLGESSLALSKQLRELQKELACRESQMKSLTEFTDQCFLESEVTFSAESDVGELRVE